MSKFYRNALTRKKGTKKTTQQEFREILKNSSAVGSWVSSILKSISKKNSENLDQGTVPNVSNKPKLLKMSRIRNTTFFYSPQVFSFKSGKFIQIRVYKTISNIFFQMWHSGPQDPEPDPYVNSDIKLLVNAGSVSVRIK